jgi:hypothetical protein
MAGAKAQWELGGSISVSMADRIYYKVRRQQYVNMADRR